MSRGSDRRAARKEEEARQRNVSINTFFSEGEKESVCRKFEVWALLGWYHHHVVAPNVGFYGWLRRMRKRIFGQRMQLHDGSKVNIELMSFLSPWVEMEIKNSFARMQAELERQEALNAELVDHVEEMHGGSGVE